MVDGQDAQPLAIGPWTLASCDLRRLLCLEKDEPRFMESLPSCSGADACCHGPVSTQPSHLTHPWHTLHVHHCGPTSQPTRWTGGAGEHHAHCLLLVWDNSECCMRPVPSTDNVLHIVPSEQVEKHTSLLEITVRDLLYTTSLYRDWEPGRHAACPSPRGTAFYSLVFLVRLSDCRCPGLPLIRDSLGKGKKKKKKKKDTTQPFVKSPSPVTQPLRHFGSISTLYEETSPSTY
ncbi:hypothetical protein B0T13DRAFT_5816 [Neurospora crassa]|nr:hypothetical protein B0T13DRAFT_5816 [Neurospora crassa]